MIRNLQNAILQIKEISDYINEYGQNISTSTEAMSLGRRR
jgi:flagellar biosynthesis chaperone FliJ